MKYIIDIDGEVATITNPDGSVEVWDKSEVFRDKEAVYYNGDYTETGKLLFELTGVPRA